jgi:hypothetical protein
LSSSCFSWVRHVRRVRTVTLIGSPQQLQRIGQLMQRDAARYEKAPPVHYLDARYFHHAYGAAAANASTNAEASDASQGRTPQRAQGAQGAQRGPRARRRLAPAGQRAGGAPTGRPASRAPLECGRAAGDWQRSAARPALRHTALCAALMRLHCFDLAYLLDDVLVSFLCLLSCFPFSFFFCRPPL